MTEVDPTKPVSRNDNLDAQLALLWLHGGLEVAIVRSAWLTAAAVVVALILAQSRLLAQDWSQPWADPEDRPPRVDLSASTGFLMPTRWSSLVLLGSVSPVTGVLEQVLSRDLRVEPDKEFTAAATYWRGRYGARVQGGFSRSSLTISTAPGTGQPAAPGGPTSVNLDTWLYDLRGAIGFVDYAPTRRVWPYGFVGLGGITYDLNQTVPPSLLTFIERGPVRSDTRTNTIILTDGRELLITADQLKVETVFAINFGVGTDVRVPLGGAGVGVRFEVSDHVAPSPVGLHVREISTVGALIGDTGVRFAAVHHLSATVGFVLQIGR